jgi:O-antigen/teichoic acid export membrane protein
LAGVLCVTAPAIAAFYRQPELTPITRALTLVLVMNSFAAVQSALMTRRLDFRRQALIAVTSTAVSGSLGVGLAWRGFGVWSLVVQQITNSFVRACLYWSLNTFRPRWMFSWKALGELFSFGSRLVASRLLNTVFDNLYPLVIGKLFSANTLGYYNRAQTIEGVASQSLGVVANRVTFPVFSRLQDEPDRLRSGLRKALSTAAFIQFPLMLGLAAIAKPLVILLLTEKWAPSIPYLQALCFVGLLYPLHLLNLNVLTAKGRSDLFFRLEVVKKALIVLNIVVTFRWGVLVMIWGQVVCSLLGYFLNSYYTRKFVGYSLLDQVRDVFPCLLAAGLMAGVVASLNLPLPGGNGSQVGFKVLVGCLIYLGISRGFSFPALGEIVGLLRRKSAAAA